MRTSTAEREEWLGLRGFGMTSAVGEYTPRAFWNLLEDCNDLVRDLDAERNKCELLRNLLNEVRRACTRDDDLPDDLLPRIDAAIDFEEPR